MKNYDLNFFLRLSCRIGSTIIDINIYANIVRCEFLKINYQNFLKFNILILYLLFQL